MASQGPAKKGKLDESDAGGASLSAANEDGVVHDTAGHRFVLELEGHEAYVSYRLYGKPPDRISLDHTFSPPELRGKGVAGKVVKAAFEHAIKNELTVLPSCSYVSGAFLDRNPQYRQYTPGFREITPVYLRDEEEAAAGAAGGGSGGADDSDESPGGGYTGKL